MVVDMTKLDMGRAGAYHATVLLKFLCRLELPSSYASELSSVLASWGDMVELTQRSAFGYWLSIAMTATPIATTVTMAPTGPPWYIKSALL